MSLSSRRAWIEIEQSLKIQVTRTASLSSRRAWIEMYVFDEFENIIVSVALLAESVD